MKVQRLRLAMTSAPLLAVTLLVSAQPAPDAATFDALLVRMKASAMRYQGHLPDFTCTETTIRQQDTPGQEANWRTLDTLEESVSFASTGRVSKTLVKKNGRPVSGKKPGGLIENAVLSGAIVPQGIFGAKAQPKFTWEHWETPSEHRVAVVAYQAIGENYPNGKTRYELEVTGRIVFDDTAGILIRTESSSVGAPGYPFGEVRVETDYAPVTISDRELILPTKAVMTTVRGERRYRSEIQFSGYRKYQSDTTIRFDDPN